MGNSGRIKRVIGLVLHALIDALMIFAGASKVFGKKSPAGGR
jgi:hypothetical protein